MAKKIKEEIVVENEGIPASRITLITLDFGRADLNELRDKLNELIARS